MDAAEFFSAARFYKFVRKQDGKLTSFWDKHFDYVVGETAKAKGELGVWSSSGKLYFNEKSAIKSSTYYGEKDAVLIEVSIHKEDFIDAQDGRVLAKACQVIREVPTDEWKTYI
ncbi:hypothetical protein [Bacillus swezeyi]|uniref:hypothetical protein n=1 Tax=Bacillus swezeyi TaxID=1925020 RepID=UPI001FCF9F6E|nr:hypothetical protein [Bacillus swezeyi]